MQCKTTAARITVLDWILPKALITYFACSSGSYNVVRSFIQLLVRISNGNEIPLRLKLWNQQQCHRHYHAPIVAFKRFKSIKFILILFCFAIMIDGCLASAAALDDDWLVKYVVTVCEDMVKVLSWSSSDWSTEWINEWMNGWQRRESQGKKETVSFEFEFIKVLQVVFRHKTILVLRDECDTAAAALYILYGAPRRK